MRAGASACLAADEFFSARISNPHTRTAYAHQVSRFLAWCEDEGLELHQVTPGLAGRFLDELPGAAPTQNQALAGLRHFFDTLVARHAAVLNPFQSVRGVRHPHGEGRTPEVTVDQARQLLASVKTDRVYGLRGRAAPRQSVDRSGDVASRRAADAQARLRAAGLPKILSPHSFRVLVVTDLLSQNVPIEDVQYLAGHAHPRTTQIYDRRRRRVSRNLVERISV